MSMSADDFFAGGTPSAKFDTVGVTVAGIITRVGEPMQQRDFTTGAPKVWDDGRPMMQLPVDVRTDLRDPDIDGDDGTRALYIKGELQKAVREAVRKASAKGLREGGHLSVTYTGDGVAKQRGMNPPKLYSAVYAAPTAAQADTFLGTTPPAPAQASSNPVAAAPSQPAATGDLLATDPRLAHLTPEQLAGARAAGWTADQCAQMFPAPTRV
jgi:hypothetical protein